MTTLSVSLGLWLDRPPDEVLETARIADVCGYRELWIGEMATYDAFALATAVGLQTQQIALTIGPLAVTVRDPVMIAMGAASVGNLTGRSCGVALGTSSPLLVEGWHGRSRKGAAKALLESVTAVRQLLRGERSAVQGKAIRTEGFRLRLSPPGGPVTVAAFGPAAIGVAANHADRMVVNLVSADAVATLCRELEESSERGRRPPLAVWVPTAVDPATETLAQLRRAVVPYLVAPGYADMFERAGAGNAVAMARDGTHPRELVCAISDDLLAAVGAIGSQSDIAERIDSYAGAGADEVVLVPAATGDDPAGERTLRSLSKFVAE